MGKILNNQEIEAKLKDIEVEIRNKNNFDRETIQRIINRIIYNVSSLEELKTHMTELIKTRAKIKIIGMKTFYTPREDLKETDKTLDFLSDIKSYMKVKERFPDA